VYLGKGKALTIRGYDPDGNFVCRLEVSNAGVTVFSGARGAKRLCNLTWEALVKRLAE
jgi:hypothetical protein